MFLRQLDLTTALRPSLYDDETLLFVQDGVGLYEGKFKIANYQNGHAYLTSHRVCYVDNEYPRRYSVAVDLKEIERCEFYAGFLKSSAKVTLFPKANKRNSQSIRSPVPRQSPAGDASLKLLGSSPRSLSSSPAAGRELNSTWICPICGMSNSVPANFDPATANQHTPLPTCQACGIRPPLALMLKAAITARSMHAPSTAPTSVPTSSPPGPDQPNLASTNPSLNNQATNFCPRCTFQNHPSLSTCEICGASLLTSNQRHQQVRSDREVGNQSPGPVNQADSILDDDSIETIKFSFRAGGEKPFYDRLKSAMVQRKWLLQIAPSVPKPAGINNGSSSDMPFSPDGEPLSAPKQRIVGIAGLERHAAELRRNNQAVIGTAFEDLEALMTSAKEVIAMAEEFAKHTTTGSNVSAEDRNLLSASESALGLVTTRDMLGGGSAAEQLYVTELARNLAEFLTDDRRGILRREGGVMSLVDLWAVFNRMRKGVELISPLDFEKAARTWDSLALPIRLRRFKSGLLVVQERSRSDQKTVAALLAWLREPPGDVDLSESTQFGKSITAQEAAERFGWSVGVATEELEMAEEMGALCRDQCLDGTRFWENFFVNPGGTGKEAAMGALSHGVDDMRI